MYEAGQFVQIRARKWEVLDDRPSTTGGDHLLHVRGIDEDVKGHDRLFIYHPSVESASETDPSIERVTLLSSADLQWPPQDTPTSWERLYDAYRLSISHSPDSLLGLSRARLVIEPYQLDPVLRVMTAPRQRFLLAEDVGMGKTIEAGLIMMELIARGRGGRVLIVVPAALQDQWGDEMYQKFGLSFQILDNETLSKEVIPTLPPGANPWTYTDRVITSIDFAKQERIMRALKRTHWDLVIVDEAHYLSESGTEQKPLRTDRSRFGDEISRLCENLLLLTATPHNGYSQGFYSLLHLLDDARFPSPSTMSREAIQSVVIRRAKKQIFDEHGDQKFTGRHIDHITLSIDDSQMRLERRLYKKISAYARSEWKAARSNPNLRVTIGFAMLLLKKRFISSPAAIRKSLNTRLSNLGKEKLDKDAKGFVSRRKGVPPTEKQQEQMDRIASAQTTIDPRDEKALERERDKIRELIKIADEITPEKDYKALKLREKLDELCFGPERRKVIVFTEYKDTLDYLQEYLLNRGYKDRLVVLHGHLNRSQRLQAEQLFHQPQTLVLLATDAASEGLNLQKECYTVIHNELPWNPNRLEQRNGRVDRWGQSKDVEIYNLVLQGTLETDILHKLMDKLAVIRDQLGVASDVLSIAEAVDMELVEDLLLDGLFQLDDPEQATSLETVEQAIEKTIDDRLHNAEDQLHSWLGHLDLARGSFGQQDYKSMKSVEDRTKEAVPHDTHLEDFALSILKELGTEAIPIQGESHIYRLEAIPASLLRTGVKNRYERVTFVGEVARNRRNPLDHIDYITQGHPLLESLIAQVKKSARQDSALSQQLGGRFAVRIMSDVPHGFLFTFLGRWQDRRGSIIAEELIPLFLPLAQPTPSYDLARQEALSLLSLPYARKNSTLAYLNEFYFPSWSAFLAQARTLARSGSQEQAISICEQRAEKLSLLEKDLHTWAEARVQWLQQQSDRRKREDEELLQLSFSDLEREGARAGALKRRQNELARDKKTVENRATERLHEIAEMKQVVAALPELIGALVIVPEEEC